MHSIAKKTIHIGGITIEYTNQKPIHTIMIKNSAGSVVLNADELSELQFVLRTEEIPWNTLGDEPSF